MRRERVIQNAVLTGIYLTLAGAFAVGYAVLLAPRPASGPRAMIKALAFGALALACVIEGAIVLAAALLLTAAADAFLVRRGSAWGWMAAACLFGAQAAYGLSFLVAGGGLFTSVLATLAQIALIGTGAFALWRLWPRLGVLRGPVIGYVGVAVFAALMAVGLPQHSLAASIGAVMALAGDALWGWSALASGQSQVLPRLAPWIVFGLHFLGRALIVAPFIAPPG